MNPREKRAANQAAFWYERGLVPYTCAPEVMTFAEAEFIAYALRVYRNRKRYPRQWRMIRDIAKMGWEYALGD